MFPNGVTVGLMAHQPGEVVDGYETEDSWADPESIEDSAIAPGNTVEDFEPNREGVSVEFTWYAPPGTTVGSKDKAVIPGHRDPLDVVGFGKAWANPFTGTDFGVVVLLGRFDG